MSGGRVLEVESVNRQPARSPIRKAPSSMARLRSAAAFAMRSQADGVEQHELVPGVEPHVRANVGSERDAVVVGVDGNCPAGLEHGLVQLGVGSRCMPSHPPSRRAPSVS
jgi:hypothetical protein